MSHINNRDIHTAVGHKLEVTKKEDVEPDAINDENPQLVCADLRLIVWIPLPTNNEIRTRKISSLVGERTPSSTVWYVDLVAIICN